MKELTQFEIKLDKSIAIKGEYEGNSKSGKVLVFSHGFGVKRDSWGMFNQVGDLLKDKYLIIRFDYNGINIKANATIVYPFSTQAEMLKKTISFIQDKFNPSEINIIAHSMGCFMVGMLPCENINKVILIASPPTSPYKRMIEYFSKRKDTRFNEKGTSKIKRSDGSWTYIYPKFWPEVKRVNPPQIYKEISQITKVYIIRAKQDEVIAGDSYNKIKNIKEIKYIELEGNHNFEGSARKPWLDKIVECLN